VRAAVEATGQAWKLWRGSGRGLEQHHYRDAGPDLTRDKVLSPPQQPLDRLARRQQRRQEVTPALSAVCPMAVRPGLL
jgi:hypothetical protein